MLLLLLRWLCLLEGAGVRAQEPPEPLGPGTPVVAAAELSRAIRDGASHISIESTVTGIVGEQSSNTSVLFDSQRYNTFPELPDSCLRDPQECLDDEQYVKVTVPTVITAANNALLDLGFQQRRVLLAQDILFQNITLHGIASDFSPFIFFFLFHNSSNLVCENCVVEHACAGSDASFFLESMRLAETSQAQLVIAEDRQSVTGSIATNLAQDITQGTLSAQSFRNCTFRCNPDLLPRDSAPVELRPDESCQSKEDAGLSYRGVQNTTVNGHTCQSWLSTTPNFHTRVPTAFPEAGLAENYCRNPDNEGGVWCYTIDGPRWERCDVPFCEPAATPTPPQSSSLSNGARNGIIAGVASVFCVGLLLAALMIWRCYRRPRQVPPLSASETPATKGTHPYTGLPLSDSCSIEAEKDRSRKAGDRAPPASPPVDTMLGVPYVVMSHDEGRQPEAQRRLKGVDTTSEGGGDAAAAGAQEGGSDGGPRSLSKCTDGSKAKDRGDSAHGPSAESVRSASSSRKSSLPAPMLELREALAEMGSDAKQLQLHELVGKGGFGSVYRGTWRGLNVAVKTVTFQERALGGSAQQRAIAEAAITFSLTHPNVIATYFHEIKPLTVSSTAGLTVVQEAGEGVQDWKLFLVQEFCEVGSLRHHIDTGSFLAPSGKPKLGKCVGCLADVARGMEYIQSRNIIHGDLNPSNILLRLLPGIASTNPPSSGPRAPLSLDSQMQSGVGHPELNSGAPSKAISNLSAFTGDSAANAGHPHTRGTASVAFGNHLASRSGPHLFSSPPSTSTVAGDTQYTFDGPPSQAAPAPADALDVIAHDLQLSTSVHASHESDSQAMHVATLAACARDDTLPQKLQARSWPATSAAKAAGSEMSTDSFDVQMEASSAACMEGVQEGKEPIAALRGVRNAQNSTASVSAVSAVSDAPESAAQHQETRAGRKWPQADSASGAAPISGERRPVRRGHAFVKTPRPGGVPNAPRRPGGGPVAEASEPRGTQGAQAAGVTAPGPVSDASSGEVDLGAAASEAAARSLSSRGMDQFSSCGRDAIMSSMQFGSGNVDLDSGHHPSGVMPGPRSLAAPSSGPVAGPPPPGGATPAAGSEVLPQHAKHAALWHRIHAVNAGEYDTSQTYSQLHSVAAPPLPAAAAGGDAALQEPPALGASRHPLESLGTPPMPTIAPPSSRSPPPTSGGSRVATSRSGSSDRTGTLWDPEPWELCAKVSDFGLSVKMDPATGHVSNLRQGTPFYIAPEVSDQGHMSMAADSFAFGVMMWECYHSLAPYCAKRGGRIVKHPRFPEFPNECPLSFAVLSASCLAVDPRDRPNFVQICGVLEDLAAHLRGEGLQETCAAHLPMHVLENTAFNNGEAEQAQQLTSEQQALTAISQILSRALPSSGKGSSEHSKPSPVQEGEGELQENELPSGAGIMPSAQSLLSRVTSGSTAHLDVRNSRGTAGAMPSPLSSADGEYSGQIPSQTFMHYSSVAGMPMAPVDEASSASPSSPDPASAALHSAKCSELAAAVRTADVTPQSPAGIVPFQPLPDTPGAEPQQAAAMNAYGGAYEASHQHATAERPRPEAAPATESGRSKEGRPPTHPGPWDVTPPGRGAPASQGTAHTVRSGSRLPSQGGSPVGSTTSGASSDLFSRTGPRHMFALPNEIVIEEEKEAAGHVEAAVGPSQPSAPATVAAVSALQPGTKQAWEEQKSKRFIEHLRALRHAHRRAKAGKAAASSQSIDDGASSGSNFSIHASATMSAPRSFNRNTSSAGAGSAGPDSPRLTAPRHLASFSQGGSTTGPGHVHSTPSATVNTASSLQHGQLDGIPYSVGASCVSVGGFTGVSGVSYQESPPRSLTSPQGADAAKIERSMVSVPWSIGEMSVEAGLTPTSQKYSRALASGFGTFMEAEVGSGEQVVTQGGTQVVAETEGCGGGSAVHVTEH